MHNQSYTGDDEWNAKQLAHHRIYAPLIYDLLGHQEVVPPVPLAFSRWIILLGLMWEHRCTRHRDEANKNEAFPHSKAWICCIGSSHHSCILQTYTIRYSSLEDASGLRTF